MRIAFMGTPAFAAGILREIGKKHQVVGVYTRPDAVRGRGSRPEPSPVKALAAQMGAPVFEPTSLKGPDEARRLRDLACDAVCVAAYGAILPESILSVPRLGCLNVHASLLPRWRGAAPIERAILAGDEQTGVCIMRMEAGLDTGAWCRRAVCAIGSKTAGELEAELAQLGAEALSSVLDDMEAGRALSWTEQTGVVTYAEKVAKGELDLSPEDGAGTSVRKVRASSAGHPAHAMLAGRRAIVERAHEADDAFALEEAARLKAGELAFARKRLLLRAQDACFEIDEVRPEGRKSMDARSFATGVQGIKGNTLEWGACE